MSKSQLQIIPLSLLGTALILVIHYKGTAINLLYMTIASFLLLACSAFALYQHCIKNQKAIPFKLPHIISFIWIIYLFASISWSYVPSNSWYYSWVVGSLPFSFLLWSWLKPMCKTQTLFLTLLIIILFYAGWAIVEFIMTSRSTLGPTMYQGVFGAFFAATVIPVISDYLSQKKQKLISIHIPIIILLLLALFSTYSRGSMLSYFMVLPVLFFSAYRQKLLIKKQALLILLLTFASYISITQYAELTGGQSMAAKTELKSGQIPGLSSMGARIKLYCSMLEIYKDYPILGTGLASFNVFYRAYRDPTEGSAGHFGHNDYLQYLQEGGPILLSFLLMALALIGWILYQCNFKTKPSFQTTGYVLAATTLFIHAAADIIFYVHALLLLAGLFLSMSYHKLVAIEEKSITLHKPKLTAGIIALGLFCAWLSLAVDTRIYTHLQWQHLWGKNYSASVADLMTLDRYYKLRPTNPEPLVRLAEFYLFMLKEVKTDKEKQDMANPALFYTLKLLEVSPRFSRMYVRLAEIASAVPTLKPAIQNKVRAYGITQDSDLNEQLLKKAIALDPNNNLASISLADYYQQQKQPAKALAVLNKAKVWLKTPKMLTSVEAYRRDKKYQIQVLNKIRELEKLTPNNANDGMT